MFILLFILIGILMYFSDVVWLRQRGKLYFSSYLISGFIVGTVVGLALRLFSSAYSVSWIVCPIVSLSAAAFLSIFARYDLYGKPFFQIFGTISLGLFSGIGAFVIFLLISIIFPETVRISIRLLLDMVIYGFLLNFGYSFVGRRHKLRQRRKQE